MASQLETLRDLLRHMEWADSLVWQAVMAHSQAVEDAELKERLHHIHMVQGAFLQIWRQEEMTVRAPGDFEALADVVAWAREYYVELESFLGSLGQERPAEDRLTEEVRLPWSDRLKERFGEVRPTDLGETMAQVALHTMHHRGQVTARLRALGGEPPLIDYISWIWRGRPAPSWPADQAARS